MMGSNAKTNYDRMLNFLEQLQTDLDTEAKELNDTNSTKEDDKKLENLNAHKVAIVELIEQFKKVESELEKKLQHSNNEKNISQRMYVHMVNLGHELIFMKEYYHEDGEFVLALDDTFDYSRVKGSGKASQIGKHDFLDHSDAQDLSWFHQNIGKHINTNNVNMTQCDIAKKVVQKHINRMHSTLESADGTWHAKAARGLVAAVFGLAVAAAVFEFAVLGMSALLSAAHGKPMSFLPSTHGEWGLAIVSSLLAGGGAGMVHHTTRKEYFSFWPTPEVHRRIGSRVWDGPWRDRDTLIEKADNLAETRMRCAPG